MAIYFNNIEVTNQIYRLAWLHVMESENKSKFGGGKGGVMRGDSVSLFCNKIKLKGINYHKPWLGTVDVAKENTIFTTTSTTAGDGKLKNQVYSKRKDVRLRYRHTASEATRVVLQHGSIRSHKRISNAKKRRGRTVKNANAIGHHCGGKGVSGRPEPIMEGVEVAGGRTSSMEAEQKAEDEGASKLHTEKEDYGRCNVTSQLEEKHSVNNDKDMSEQRHEDMQGTAISNSYNSSDKNNNSSTNSNDSTNNNQRGVEIADKDDQTHASTTTSNESTAGVVVNGPGDEDPHTHSSSHQPTTTSGSDTTTTGDTIVKVGDKTTTAGKFGEPANEKSMDVKIDETNFSCSDVPASLLKLVDQKPGCSTSAMGADQHQPTGQSSLSTPEGAIGEEDENLPNSMLSYPLLVDIYKGNMRAKEIDSATLCQKEKEINEKLSSSTLPDICITNVVKSAQSLGKGIRECIAIYKNVKELKERIHNRSLPEILNTENEDKINKVKHLLFEISESVALYENVRNLEKELTSPPRKDKANQDVWKRKIPGRTRKQLNSRASSSLPSNFQESDEDGIVEEGQGEAGEEEGMDNNVVIVVDEEDDGEEGDIEDIADDDSSEDEKKNLKMMEKLNEKLATAVNVV